jgi:hypothetical protein
VRAAFALLPPGALLLPSADVASAVSAEPVLGVNSCLTIDFKVM